MRQQRGKMKKLALALLALMMVVCLGACGGGEEESVEEVMRKSQENMAALSSMTYTMDMNMGISAAGQSLNVATLATMDYTVDPFAIKGELSMDMGELGAMELSMYAVENEDGYVSYIQMPGDPTWYKQPLENMETLEQYDARENLDLFLSSSKSFQEQGTEEILSLIHISASLSRLFCRPNLP